MSELDAVVAEYEYRGRPQAEYLPGPFDTPNFVRQRPSRLKNTLVICGLLAIILTCLVIIAMLFLKQQSIDNSPGQQPWKEFPVYVALTGIPDIACAIAGYLLFRWITRLTEVGEWERRPLV
jgi:heme/copper-type cytochrome/quinol oxidase subunit 2